MKKSTYFNKYESSNSFTKTVKETVKITTYLNKSILNDFIKVLNNKKNEKCNKLILNKKIKNLKTEFQK